MDPDQIPLRDLHLPEAIGWWPPAPGWWFLALLALTGLVLLLVKYARRRAMGKREINSVWFWGGGFIPDASEHYLLDTVYSENAVSRGLAIINDCRTRAQMEALDSDFAGDGRSVLIDWAFAPTHPENEMALLEGLVGRLLAKADRGLLRLTLYDGGGQGRYYGKNARRRFWRRRVALPQALDGSGAE